MIDPIQEVVNEIEKNFGAKVVMKRLFSNQVVIKKSSGNHLPSISVMSTSHPGIYSVQVEVSDESVPLVGLNIPFVSESVSLSQILKLVGEYVVAG